MPILGWRRKAKENAAAAGLHTICRRAPHVMAAREGERTVLLDPRGGEYLGLDEVASRIWELLDGATTAAGVVDRLEAEYDAPRATLEADCLALLTRLMGLGVVVTAG
ncbi:MAG TPA: PqqD family protein [Longimicrobiaceae bacterium]|nr:PqqD family protein [Longimicrobiaceae bacterium]